MNKNPFEYGYLGDERFEISAMEYNLLRVALEQGLEATQSVDYPEVFQFIDTATSKKATKYTDEDLALGRVVRVTDKEATFSQGNAQVSYNGLKLKAEMLHAQELLMDIHVRNMESGIAKPIADLQATLAQPQEHAAQD